MTKVDLARISARGAGVPTCILIVDDSLVIRRSLRRLLEAAGWEICGEAENGKEAIEKARQIHSDVIILDLAMPVMNGFEAARELKRTRPGVPLIMYTMFDVPQLEREALNSGCSAVVNKAGPPALLIESIQRLLRAAA